MTEALETILATGDFPDARLFPIDGGHVIVSDLVNANPETMQVEEAPEDTWAWFFSMRDGTRVYANPPRISIGCVEEDGSRSINYGAETRLQSLYGDKASQMFRDHIGVPEDE